MREHHGDGVDECGATARDHRDELLEHEETRLAEQEGVEVLVRALAQDLGLRGADHLDPHAAGQLAQRAVAIDHRELDLLLGSFEERGHEQGVYTTAAPCVRAVESPPEAL